MNFVEGLKSARILATAFSTVAPFAGKATSCG